MPAFGPPSQGSNVWVQVPVPTPVQRNPQPTAPSPQGPQPQQPARPVKLWNPPPLTILPHAQDQEEPEPGVSYAFRRPGQPLRFMGFGLGPDIGAIAAGMDGLPSHSQPGGHARKDYARAMADRFRDDGHDAIADFVQRAHFLGSPDPYIISDRTRYENKRSPYVIDRSRTDHYFHRRLKDAPDVHLMAWSKTGWSPIGRSLLLDRALPHFHVQLVHEDRTPEDPYTMFAGEPIRTGHAHLIGAMHTTDHRMVRGLVNHFIDRGEPDPQDGPTEDGEFLQRLHSLEGRPVRRPQKEPVHFSLAPLYQRGMWHNRPRINRRWRYPDEHAREEAAIAAGMAVSGRGHAGSLRAALQRRGQVMRFAAGSDDGGAEVRRILAGYTHKYGGVFGIQPYRVTPRRPIDLALSVRTADAFHAMPHAPQEPRVLAAYRQLMHEIAAQYNHIHEAGVHMEPWTQPGQPYKNSAEMVADARGRRHLWFFPTINPHEASFGSTQGDLDPAQNPLVEKSGHVVNGVPLTYNDLLRAVHDYAAHASVGNEFGPLGEYNAWAEHAKLFSPLAMHALTTETHGQNSWVNFGPHLRRHDGSLPRPGDPDYKKLTERPFAEQKVNLLPSDAIPPEPYSDEPMRFQQMRAPAGGMATRGIFQPGGEFLPAEATGPAVPGPRGYSLLNLLRKKRQGRRLISGTTTGGTTPATP